MCSKSNDADAAECAYCGARLKPLVIEHGSAAAPAPEPAGDQASPTPDADWLSRLRGPEEGEPAPEGAPEQAGESEDWLARLRATDPQWEAGPPAPATASPAAEPGPSEGLDWLGRLRQAESESDFGPPEGEVPDWLRAEAEPEPAPAPELPSKAEPSAPQPGGEVPDWLARIREKQAHEREEPEVSPDEAPPDRFEGSAGETTGKAQPEPEADVFDLEKAGWHSGLTGLLEPMPEAGQPPAEPPRAAPDVFDLEASDWHSGLTGLLESPPDVTPPTAPEPPEHGGLTGLLPSPEAPPVQPEHGGLTGLLPSQEVEPAKPPKRAAPREDLSGPERLERAAARTSELKAAAPPGPAGQRPKAPSSESPLPPQGAGPGLADLIARSEPKPVPKPAWGPSVPPEGMQPPVARPRADEASKQPGPAVTKEPLGAPVPPGSPTPSSKPEAATIPPSAAFEVPTPAAGAETAGTSDWLGDLGAPPEAPATLEPELPHVPALIHDAGEGGGLGPGGDIDLGAIEVPDWLAEAGTASEQGAGGEARPDLAPATLPAWLEAMRPVETFRSVVEITPEEEQAVEAAGPLAGLRGVLLAEPVVAMPRTASLGAGRLNVTERQYAQAELLRRLVEDEQREAPARTHVRLRPPILRWAVAALLVLAVALSVLSGSTAFPLPGVQPSELAPLMSLIGGLPTDRPALLVFDYEPGYSAEMNAVAGALITQLMTRGVPIATVSTRPTGPPLAEALIGQLAQQHGYVNGQNYVHLGYLSGGTPAVQLFAAAPRDSLLSGFAPAGNEAVAAGWSSAVVANVQRLSDFGMVGIITAGADSARLWAEQASPWMGGRPLVMVLSAGTEPLVRPYYEALHPQVNGLLTGLPAAVAYEIHNAQPGEAQARWNGFGAGMLMVELILVAGAVYGLAVAVLRLRTRRAKAGNP